jgi:uncharacterized protein (UPF0333 family)
MLKRKKGQSTLEYITVFVVVIAAIVVVISGVLRPAVNQVITSSATRVNTAATQFSSASIIP